MCAVPAFVITTVLLLITAIVVASVKVAGVQLNLKVVTESRIAVLFVVCMGVAMQQSFRALRQNMRVGTLANKHVLNAKLIMPLNKNVRLCN